MSGAGGPRTQPAHGRRAGVLRLAARLATVALLTATLNVAPIIDPEESSAAVSESAQLNRLQVRLTNVSRSLQPLEEATTRISPWLNCISMVGVDEAGNFDGAQGYHYDDRDGTVPGWTSALALHAASKLAPEYTLLDFSSDDGCQSRLAPQEGSTPPPPVAGATMAPVYFRRLSPWVKIKVLNTMAVQLDQRMSLAADAVATFDEWESCTSWLPVTEYGNPDGAFGYSQGGGDPGSAPYRSAISVDRSAWDDPDYELLVFKGADRPFTSVECSSEPGEGTDRALRVPPRGADRVRRAGSSPATPVTIASAIEDLGNQVDDFEEGVEDLVDPVQNFELFDGCMYTIGASSSGDANVGYEYTEGAVKSRRDALAFDVGARAPAYNFMVFPGEEPPQIECDEDAGGQDTDG